MKRVPVAVSDRDGFGHILGVEVGGGTIREAVPILAADGSLVGEVTSDGVAYWDVATRRLGVRIAPVEVRRALATTGRLSASVDEQGTVVALRVEESQGISTRARGASSSTNVPVKAGDEVEIFNRSGRILRVESPPPGR
jgi:molybdopterin converting factor small subunit